MPSRMEKYYKKDKVEYSRTEKNKKTYDESYDVKNLKEIENFSPSLKESKINYDILREMIEKKSEPKEEIKVVKITEEIDVKNYDLNDIIVKAKTERPDEDSIYKKVNLENTSNVDIENIINEISNDLEQEGDDLIADLNMEETRKIEEKEIDKSFYTSSFELSKEDYEDDDFVPKKSNWLLIIFLFILITSLVVLISYGIYYLLNS